MEDSNSGGSKKFYKFNNMKNNNAIFFDKYLESITQWYTVPYNLDHSLLTPKLLRILVNNFMDQLHKVAPGKQVFLLVILNYEGGRYKTLSKASKVSSLDRDALISNLIQILRLKSDQYQTDPFSQIIFKYKHVSREQESETPIIHAPKNPESFNPNLLQIGDYHLPDSMRFLKWGQIVGQRDGKLLIKCSQTNKANGSMPDGDLLYMVEIVKLGKLLNVSIINTFGGVESEILSFTDEMDIDENNFTRTVNNQKYIVRANDIVCRLHYPNVHFIKPLNKSSKGDVNIITLDIETRTIDGVMTPYCICFFDGNESYSYYLSDYNSVDAMLLDCIDHLIRPKYMGFKVYIHNLSHFDGIFLIRILARFVNKHNLDMKIIKRDTSIISIKITLNINGKNYTIEFRDSLLTLPSSLNSLAKSFKVESKGLFPYSFVNDNNVELDYKGAVPSFNYFPSDKVTLYEYEEYKKGYSIWDLKGETIKYCVLDCIVLHQVLTKFNNLVFTRFNVTINKYPTLPSLAFGIFRVNYLGDTQIPKLVGDIYKFIRKGYTGGAVDVYKVRPSPSGEGEVVKAYDVNSLYPTSMSFYDVPVGSPIFFEVIDPTFDLKELNRLLNKDHPNEQFVDCNPFGFFNVDVKTPDSLEHPILQTRVKTSEGYRTLAPLGEWSDVVFSEEMYNAEKFGYTFNIKSGYFFERGKIFINYIKEIYSIKENTPNTDPMYFISKLLLNSLYGKFGMAYELDDHEVIRSAQLDSYLNNPKIEVGNFEELGDDLVLVSYLDTSKYDGLDFNTIEPNISIGIASAITAYSRMFMAQFKNNSNFTLYYSDTDSVYVSGDFPQDVIGKGLGKFKLENTFKDVVFLAPKVYGGITTEGNLIVKIKGLTKSIIKADVTFDKLLTLLNKDSNLVFKQIKSYKSFPYGGEGTISLLEQTYNLIPTETKRELIYKNNILVATKPYVINKDKVIRSGGEPKDIEPLSILPAMEDRLAQGS